MTLPLPNSDFAVPPSRKSSRGWVIFFVVLVAPLPFVIGIPIWYNIRQQLQPDRLAQARQLWESKGPRDYTAEYLVRLEYNPDPAGRTPDRYLVTVRAGRVQEIVGPTRRPIGPGGHEFSTMDDLMELMTEQLEDDIAAGGRRPFTIAVFNREDGHVARYRRSVIRTRELYEVEVKMRPIDQQ